MNRDLADSILFMLPARCHCSSRNCEPIALLQVVLVVQLSVEVLVEVAARASRNLFPFATQLCFCFNSGLQVFQQLWSICL
jgi:hypothetical protein